MNKKIEETKKEIEKKKEEFQKKKIVKEGNKFFGEFKEFAIQGKALDLAIGVVIGGAFGKIVSSLVSDIIMPAVGIFVGGINFSNLTLKVKDATINYGTFIQNVVDFLIIAFCIFVFIKIVEKLTKKKKEEEKVKADEQIVLLREIRDVLKDKKTNKKTE